MSHNTNSTPMGDSGLCSNCEALRFDDGGCGGFMGTSDKGTPRLRFKEETTGDLPPGVSKLLMSQQRIDSSPDFSTLANSATAGCSFCGFLRDAVLRADIQALKKPARVSIQLAYVWRMRNSREPGEQRLKALVAEICDDQGGTVGDLHFAIYPSTDQVDAAAEWLGLVNPPPRTETLCPENVSFLQRALESCISDCHPPRKTSFLPTRLLDLGTDPAAHPRLIITADSIRPAARPVRYAAVSYCWGTQADASTQTKTESSNLHERLQAIPIRDTSAVMQDAIAVCRALSVRYVWIDALCIIQDPVDTSDWQRESERAGQVYQHAYFTICAMATTSCHQSFLARSQHTFDFDFRSSLYVPAQGKYTLHSTALYSGRPVFDPMLIDLYSSSWSRRGWVYQERELSPRKLLFGRHMVHFGCGGIQASENGETFAENGAMDWIHRTNPTREQVYRGFRSAVRRYSDSELAYESDRLPALAGVAKRVLDFTGSQYLAGLWMEDLHVGLLWIGGDPGTKKQSLAERLETLDPLRASRGVGAPSWSWVSHPGWVYYLLHTFVHGRWNDSHTRPEYTSVEGWTALKGAGLNQFGEVESGTIRITGKVLPMPADFVLEGDADRIPKIRKGSHHGAAVADCYLDWAQWAETPTTFPGRLTMLLTSSTCNPSGTAKAGINNTGPGTASKAGGTCALCLDEKHRRDVAGLIIHPAEKTGEYYRVGVFESRADHAGGAGLFDNLEDACVCLV